MHQLPAVKEESLRSSLRKFLRSKTEEIPPPQYCKDCNSLLVNIVMQLWIDGDDEVWNIALPFCLHCDPELATRAVAAAA
jgi:hypothetical protein